jgi:sugar phosphate isomerase/epimerase
VETYGDRIALVHCHDVRDGVDHRPLCLTPEETPVLDWEAALQALLEKGFDGPVVLELYGLEGKIQSLAYLQRLLD